MLFQQLKTCSRKEILTIIKLNKEQQLAVDHGKGPLLILAGAGTGKTATVIKRIEKLIKKDKINPYNILAITFTNKAVNEIKERISILMKTTNHHLNISTIHSLSYRLLNTEVESSQLKKNFSIITPKDSYSLINSVIEKNLKKEIENKNIYILLNIISNLKSELITPKIYKMITTQNSAPPYIDYQKSLKIIKEIPIFLKDYIYNIYNSYEKLLKKNNCIDFDGLLTQATYLLIENKKILGKYQNHYKYIIVDEYQDTNHAQYILIQLLAAKYKNITVVGDDKQSIYKFRNADYRNILNFESDYKETKIIKLEINYRSYQPILDVANQLIENNKNQKKITLKSYRGNGDIPSIKEQENPYEEAEFIANEIEKLVKQGYIYQDIAILFRIKAQSGPLENIFIKKNIPYTIYGGLNFYERKEIKILIMYLNFLNNTNNELYLKNIINTPPRGIGNKTINTISSIANNNNISLWEACIYSIEHGLLNTRKTHAIKQFSEMILDLKNKKNEFKIGQFVTYLTIQTGLNEYYEKKETDTAKNRLENIDQFEQTAWYYQIEKETSYDDFLLVLALQQNTKNENGTGNINLLTIHSSKGLEYPIVFLIGVEENLLPYYRAIDSNDPEDIEEERRLCYVGITRAKDKLYISHCNERILYGNISNNMPSRFLIEIGYKKTEDTLGKDGILPW